MAAEAILLSIHLGASVPAVLREIASIACDRYLSNASGMLETIVSRLACSPQPGLGNGDDYDKAEEAFEELSAFVSTTCIVGFAASAQKLLPSLTLVRQSLRDVCATSLHLTSAQSGWHQALSPAASLLNAIATHNLAALYSKAIVAGEDMDVNPNSGENDAAVEPFVERISAQLEQLIKGYVVEAEAKRGREQEQQQQGTSPGLVAMCAPLITKLFSSAMYHESLLTLCQASKQSCGEPLRARLHGLLLWHMTKLGKGGDSGEEQCLIMQDSYAGARGWANQVARSTLKGNGGR